MAMLIAQGIDSISQSVTLHKPITSIGSDKNVDMKLLGEKIPRVAAQILRQGTNFLLMAADKMPIYVRGSAITKHILLEGDEIFLDKYTLLFADDIKESTKSKPKVNSDLEVLALTRLLDFSRRLAKESKIPMLLEALIDEIIAVTRAEHGFLVLLENGLPKITVGREAALKPLSDASDHLSDSILKKVLESRLPILISDALNDNEFCASKSVIDFKLSSVMCVPLMHQGELIGAIYVGNNSFVNVFSNEGLEILTVFAGQAALLVQHALHINALTAQTESLKQSLELTKFGGVVGSCKSMQEVFASLEKAAQSDVGVLIIGQAGTGKELIARELHNRSPRKNAPFIVVNCKGVPENILEGEIFGKILKTATGLRENHVGRLREAQAGTLFLDEVSELPMYLQEKLLDALNGKFIEVRLIASSNKNLNKFVEANNFCTNLLYLLNVILIEVPPLKERGNDVLVIATYFLNKYTEIYNKKISGFSTEARHALLNYDWPGNVRQLENRIRRATVMCNGFEVSPKDLDISPEESVQLLSLNDALERFRHRYIAEALERNGGNKTKTARELGVDPRTIFRHLEAGREVS